MGDIIMMTPALQAIKETFNCKITLLTSVAGSLIAPYIKYIDDTLIYNLPWVKSSTVLNAEGFKNLIEVIQSRHFDGAVVSTVYSQNPLPAALLAYQTNIPKRVGYSRENPYKLLTDWIIDEEPLSFIQHQVQRELNLVSSIGARINNKKLSLAYNKNCFNKILEKLSGFDINVNNSWIVLHTGVSEDKRKYPKELWIEVVRLLQQQIDEPILLTGSESEYFLVQEIYKETHGSVYNVAGLFTIEEFICLIKNASLAISVNTAAMHIAAAVQTPVVALYALTNPQHTPWKVPSVVLPFSVPEKLKSNNQIIKYVSLKNDDHIDYPLPSDVVKSALSLSQIKAEN